MAKGEKWIQGAHLKKGALRQELGIKGDKPIPEAKLEKAAHSKDKLLAKRARLAETLKSLPRKGSK